MSLFHSVCCHPGFRSYFKHYILNLLQNLLIAQSVPSLPSRPPLPLCPCGMLFSQNWGKAYLVQDGCKLNFGLYFSVSLSLSIYVNPSRPVFAKPLLTVQSCLSSLCIEHIWCSLGLPILLFTCFVFPSDLEVLESNCLYYPHTDLAS